MVSPKVHVKALGKTNAVMCSSPVARTLLNICSALASEVLLLRCALYDPDDPRTKTRGFWKLGSSAPRMAGQWKVTTPNVH